MNAKNISNTNIFCMIGKPGAGRSTLLKYILSDNAFVSENNIVRLVYGTTRPMRPGDIDGETYHFISKEDFFNIDEGEIIESRSYDPFYDKEYYYFTLKSYIKYGCNHIAKTSLFQYGELKKWAELTELKYPTIKINVYPIVIEAPIFERERRLMNNAAIEDDVYSMCTKLISERYEFTVVTKENPEIMDPTNPNTLIIDNSKTEKRQILILAQKIEKFIENKLIMQGK